jgi:hypothetical protein
MFCARETEGRSMNRNNKHHGFGNVFYPHNLSRNKFKKEDRKMLQPIWKTAFVYGQKDINV